MEILLLSSPKNVFAAVKSFQRSAKVFENLSFAERNVKIVLRQKLFRLESFCILQQQLELTHTLFLVHYISRNL